MKNSKMINEMNSDGVLATEISDGLVQRIATLFPQFNASRVPRNLLEDYVGQVILDLELLSEHLLWVTSNPGIFSTFVDEDIQEIVAFGLSRLSDDQLLLLAVDELALVELRSELLDGEPADCWDEHLMLLHSRRFPISVDEQSGSACDSEPETLEGVAKGSRALKLYGWFSRRMHIESQGIARLQAIGQHQRTKIIAQLHAIQAKLFNAEGSEFRKLDAQFHQLIALVGIENRTAIEAMEFIVLNSNSRALTKERRQRVWLEHQLCLDFLKKDDFENAARALSDHLSAARQRWLPNVEWDAIKQNVEFYDRMTLDSRLFVCALNVHPIEMETQFLNTIGMKAALAIGRGAKLIYLRPSQRLLDRWITRRKMVELASSSAIENKHVFDRFFEFAVEVLSATGDFGTQRTVSDLVSERLVQLELDSDELFSMTKPNCTIGLFSYDQSKREMTYRDSFSDSSAWFEIRSSPKADLNDQHFASVVLSALNELKRSRRPVDEHRAAFLTECCEVLESLE
ncbi:MAG: hypothetical protein H6824_14215 [Planctomycetaceae bacterium]|nr:hypothetical protein [Planctomycetaceae bacterium]